MVIVIHDRLKCKDLGIYFLSFDFFEPKSKKRKRKMGYKMECGVAKKFLERFPEFEYRGSEDLTYVGLKNAVLVGRLIKGKHTVYVYDDSTDEFMEV